VESLAKLAVDAAFSVHVELGPGLLEGAYEACLARELQLRRVNFQRQLEVPLWYKGVLVEVGFRADVVLEQRLLLELKAVDGLLPIHDAQVITYLKLMNLPLGLLINFNVPLIKDGVHRVLNLHLKP
jgi:GxxExxY protein